MKTKYKILATVLSMAMVLTVIGVGVFAATQSSVNASNGSINFNATGVYIEISGKIQDEIKTDYLEKDYNQKNFDENNLGSSSLASLPSWDIGRVDLAENNTFVSYALSVTNHSDFSVLATYTAPQDITGIVATAKHGETETASGGSFVIAKGESVNFVITARLLDFSKSIDNAAFNFGLSFVKQI